MMLGRFLRLTSDGKVEEGARIEIRPELEHQLEEVAGRLKEIFPELKRLNARLDFIDAEIERLTRQVMR